MRETRQIPANMMPVLAFCVRAAYYFYQRYSEDRLRTEAN
jgi:hypothetical protein